MRVDGVWGGGRGPREFFPLGGMGIFVFTAVRSKRNFIGRAFVVPMQSIRRIKDLPGHFAAKERDLRSFFAELTEPFILS